MYYFDKEIRVDQGLIGSYDENLSLRTSGTTRMTIQTADGNVGVGTASPGYKLDVVGGMRAQGSSFIGTGTDALSLELQGSFHRMAYNQLRFWDWNTGADMVTFNDGRVGINTASPGQALHVIGTTRVSTLSGSGNRIVMTDNNGDLYPTSSLAGTGLGDNLGNHTATTTLNMNGSAVINAGRYEPYGINGNSGQGNHAYAIFQEGGAWTFPYPDLRIAYHTGIKLGANAQYNGIRFYTDYDMSNLVMSINDNSTGGGGNVYMTGWAISNTGMNAPVFNVGNYNNALPAFQDGQFYRYNGQAELRVDDWLYIRDNGGAVKIQFNTDDGDLNLNGYGDAYGGVGGVNAAYYHTGPNDSWFPYPGNNFNYFRGTTVAFNSTWYDENDVNYYIDPNNASLFNDLRSTILYDRWDTYYQLDLNSWQRMTGDNYVSHSGGMVRVGHNYAPNYCVGGWYCCSWDWWGNCSGNCYNACQSTATSLKFSVYGGAESWGGWWGWSDGRFKKNVSTISNAVDIVKNMRGVTYDWKEMAGTYDDAIRSINGQKYDASSSRDEGGHEGFRSQVGVIAQELKEVLPMAVMEVEDKDSTGKVIGSHMTVNYDNVIPVLIEAIKEQQQQIEELRMLVGGATSSNGVSSQSNNQAMFAAMRNRALTMDSEVQQRVEEIIAMIENGHAVTPQMRNVINEFIVNGTLPEH